MAATTWLQRSDACSGDTTSEARKTSRNSGTKTIDDLRAAGVLDQADDLYDAIERGENPLDVEDTDALLAKLRHAR